MPSIMPYATPQYLWTTYDPAAMAADPAAVAAHYQAQQAAAAHYMYAPMMMQGMAAPYGMMPEQQVHGQVLAAQSPGSTVATKQRPKPKGPSIGEGATQDGKKAALRYNLQKRLKLRVQQREELATLKHKLFQQSTPSKPKEDTLPPETRAAIRSNIQKRLKLRMMVKGTLSPEEANLSPEDIQEVSGQIPLVGSFPAVATATGTPIQVPIQPQQQQQQQHQQQQFAQLPMLQQSMYAQAAGAMMPYGVPYGYQVVYPYGGMPVSIPAMMPPQMDNGQIQMTQVPMYNQPEEQNGNITNEPSQPPAHMEGVSMEQAGMGTENIQQHEQPHQQQEQLLNLYAPPSDDRRLSWTLPVPDQRRFSFSLFSPNQLFAPSTYPPFGMPNFLPQQSLSQLMENSGETQEQLGQNSETREASGDPSHVVDDEGRQNTAENSQQHIGTTPTFQTADSLRLPPAGSPSVAPTSSPPSSSPLLSQLTAANDGQPNDGSNRRLSMDMNKWKLTTPPANPPPSTAAPSGPFLGAPGWWGWQSFTLPTDGLLSAGLVE